MEYRANVLDGVQDSVVKGYGDIGDLPAAIGIDPQGRQVFVSRWTPDEHERRLIAEGGDVYLMVYGSNNGHPPVYVSGEAPFGRQVQVPRLMIGLPTRRAETPPGATGEANQNETAPPA